MSWNEIVGLASLLEALAMAMPGLGLILAVALLSETAKGIRKRQANRIRNRQFALEEMEHMSADHFKRMFRMSRFAFGRLVDIVSSKSKAAVVVKATNSSGSEISIITKVACVLRWLAGGSYIDICFAFGIAPGSFYHEDGVLWGTMKIIDACFTIGFPFNDT
jgi:hypothetical protein